MKPASVSPAHGQLTRVVRIRDGGAGSSADGRPAARGERNQNRVTMPNPPPPPPVWAHHRSRFGSSGSRVAMIVRAVPSLPATTTSTAYRWSTMRPKRRDSGPYPPPLTWPPTPTSGHTPPGTVTPQPS